MIARSVLRLKAEKPVATFIGGLGASGGYMIASATERIFALPSAIVGAIGVISYRPLVYEALSRIGVEMRVAKSGRLKDMLSPFREATQEEQAKEQHLLDSLYELFVSGVASGRRLPVERVRALATGEVYVAADALRHGLIDQIGDLDDAVDWAVQRGGVQRRVRVMRPRRTLRDLAFGRTSVSAFAALLGELEEALPPAPYALYVGYPRPRL
jgi:protease-4